MGREDRVAPHRSVPLEFAAELPQRDLCLEILNSLCNWKPDILTHILYNIR